MSGAGEALGGIALIEPIIKACYKSYGIYRLTSSFGVDYERAARSLEGQMARLQILADTRLNDLLSKPTDDEDLMSTVVGVLQDMRAHFEKCQALMKRHTDLSLECVPLESSPSNTSTQASSVILTERSDQQPPTEAQGQSGRGFWRKTRSILSPVSTHSTSPPHPKTLLPGGLPIYNQRVTDATEQSAMRAKQRQKSSPLLSRLIWAATDRREFLLEVSELSRGNGLLERMLDIKPLSDPAFHGSFRKKKEEVSLTEFNRSWLDRLHTQLLELNPKGSEVEFSIRLAIDAEIERNTHSPLVDHPFDPRSSVFALQAHRGAKSEDRNHSLYLLAEVPVNPETDTRKIHRLTESFHDLDPAADPALQVIGTHPADNDKPNVRIYQDYTAAWQSTNTLATALRDSRLRSSSLQRYHVQLALLIAFSFAILPCTYMSREAFPQAGDYVYYDQLDEATTSSNGEANSSGHLPSAGEDELTVAEELLSPWYRFHLGSRPRQLGTKALGKRPGVIPTQQNPIVALGILLSQIGLWEFFPASGGITQMRQLALEKSHELMRLSGVEFEEITRRCLNWKEYGENEKRNNAQEMLQMVFLRLSAHNRAIQRL